MKPIAIFSSDDNPDYAEFAPLIQELWENLGFEPFYARIGSEEFPAVPGIPTSLQAQIVRLYASKIWPDRVILTTDIDMVPLDRRYYQARLAKKPGQISLYSYDAHNGTRYPMCYISSYGQTLANTVLTTDNETWTEFVQRLHSLGQGWNTDEIYVTAAIDRSAHEIVRHSRGWVQGRARNRLDRIHWIYDKDTHYIDAHCPRPYSQHKQLIDSLKNLQSL